MIITRHTAIFIILHTMFFPPYLDIGKEKVYLFITREILSPVPHVNILLISSTISCMSWIIAVMRRMLARRFSNCRFSFFFPIGLPSFRFICSLGTIIYYHMSHIVSTRFVTFLFTFFTFRVILVSEGRISNGKLSIRIKNLYEKPMD